MKGPCSWERIACAIAERILDDWASLSCSGRSGKGNEMLPPSLDVLLAARRSSSDMPVGVVDISATPALFRRLELGSYRVVDDAALQALLAWSCPQQGKPGEDGEGTCAPIRPGCGGFGIRNFLTLFLSIEVSKAMLDSQLAILEHAVAITTATGTPRRDALMIAPYHSMERPGTLCASGRVRGSTRQLRAGRWVSPRATR